MGQFGLRGDFKGFTFNNIHSSTLGITRVSDSNRYTDTIVPTFSDTTVDIAGANGKRYFGSTYTKRDIPVSFVFDDLTEQQLVFIRQLWNDKQIHDLIFDEAPYKVYSARVTGNSVMKYIAFDDGKTHYRGEGSLTFTCYFPYARSRYPYREFYTTDNINEWVSDDQYNILLEKVWKDSATGMGSAIYYDFDVAPLTAGAAIGSREDFEWVSPSGLLTTVVEDDWDETMNSEIRFTALDDSIYKNYDEWIAASRIPSRGTYGYYDAATQLVKFYNAGDMVMPTRWWYRVSDMPADLTLECVTTKEKLELTHFSQLHGVSPTGAGADAYILIDMPNGHIEGYDAYNRRTGRLYDKFMTQESKFFALPLGESKVTSTLTPYQIDANYLYF